MSGLPAMATIGEGAVSGLLACFDFCLRSEIPLPELLPAGEVRGRDVVEIRLGTLPEALANAHRVAPALHYADGEVLLTIEGVGRYLVRGGREIVVDPAAGGSERNLRLFLLGSALGLLCYQRDLLPLHANAIVADGGAYAFAGPSGAGKSTLAAHFGRAGYPVLCDDVCVISFSGEVPLAWPGLPRLKLWGDAAAAFGHDRRDLDQAIEGLDKYHVPLAAAAAPAPVPFRRLYLLARAGEGEAEAIIRLRGLEAMEAVMGQAYRGLYIGPMGLTARYFEHCAALLAGAEVYEARRAWGYAVFDEAAGRLERHIAGKG